MKLTAQVVERPTARERRQEIPDDLCTGPYLTIQPSGKKGWQVRYRHGGTHRRMSLGQYPVLTLADARTSAREVLAEASEGKDPAEALRAAKAPKPEADRDRIRSLIEQYDRRHLSTLRTGAAVRRALDHHVVAAWGERDVQEC